MKVNNARVCFTSSHLAVADDYLQNALFSCRSCNSCIYMMHSVFGPNYTGINSEACFEDQQDIEIYVASVRNLRAATFERINIH
ncbi:hypothetical protein GJ496_010372 [Pomphorhynchus laevis]|nr:hypothetical protein GJ496_010372 [Pomphorhynchus laevis]